MGVMTLRALPLLQKRLKSLFLILAFIIIASAFITLVASRRTFYQFSLILPEEVNATAGSNITINGGILNTGMFWLHKFNITVEDCPYEYEVTPSYWEEVRILREWDPQRGVYRVPESFTITIRIPEDAYGVHVIKVTGQEHHSFRQVANDTFFVLKVRAPTAAPPAPPTPPPVVGPKLKVSDILMPETVVEQKPFNVTYRIVNEGDAPTAASVTIMLPEEWEVKNATQLVSIKANDSAVGRFEVTPSATPGEVSLYVEYPYNETILNLTKVGPYVQPVTAMPALPNITTTTVPEEVEKPFFVGLWEEAVALFNRVIARVKAVLALFTPLTLGIVVFLLVVIAWLSIGIVKSFTARKKPERSKKLSFAKMGIDNL